MATEACPASAGITGGICRPSPARDPLLSGCIALMLLGSSLGVRLLDYHWGETSATVGIPAAVRRGWVEDKCLVRVAAALLCCLAACGTSPGSGQSQARSAVTVYVVQRGDTLYSIACHGLITARQPQVNSIVDPYTIYPGQKIYLWQVSSSPAQDLIRTPPRRHRPTWRLLPRQSAAALVVVTWRYRHRRARE